MNHCLQVILFCTLVVLTACSGTTACNENYYEYQSNQCCADSNQNAICDQDEGTTPSSTKDLQEREKAVEELTERLQDDSANVYEAIQESFNKQCYIWMNEGQGDEWVNFMGGRCEVVQDCVDFYMSLRDGTETEDEIEVARRQVNDMLRNNILRCTAIPPDPY